MPARNEFVGKNPMLARASANARLPCRPASFPRPPRHQPHPRRPTRFRPPIPFASRSRVFPYIFLVFSLSCPYHFLIFSFSFPLVFLNGSLSFPLIFFIFSLSFPPPEDHQKTIKRPSKDSIKKPSKDK